VVEAARHRQFSIYPIASIDEGIEILTGIRPASAARKGAFRPAPSTGWWKTSSGTFAERARGFSKGSGDPAASTRDAE